MLSAMLVASVVLWTVFINVSLKVFFNSKSIQFVVYNNKYRQGNDDFDEKINDERINRYLSEDLQIEYWNRKLIWFSIFLKINYIQVIIDWLYLKVNFFVIYYCLIRFKRYFYSFNNLSIAFRCNNCLFFSEFLVCIFKFRVSAKNGSITYKWLLIDCI